MEYRDIHNTSDAVETYLEKISSSSMSNKQKKDINEFVNLLKLGKIGAKVRGRRIASYLQSLSKIWNYFQKDISTITEKEAENFYKDLQEDKIKRHDNTPYASATKDELVKALKRYLGWKWGKDSKAYHKGVRWMKEGTRKSNKKAITLKQVEEVLAKQNDRKFVVRDKCLFMLLFDSGGRIEEVLNVRIGDLKTAGDKDKYFIVHLRGTKTSEADRTIPIPLTTKYLNAWLEKHPTGKEEDFLFPMNYDNARILIKEMTKLTIGIEINPHELRHSSATHYIQFGGFGAENIGGFYYRYGWKFGSEEALTYIKQYMYGGELGHEKVVKHIIADRIGQLEKENDDFRIRLDKYEKLLQEAMAHGNKVVENVEKRISIQAKR